jgi:hypothetical protein
LPLVLVLGVRRIRLGSIDRVTAALDVAHLVLKHEHR